VASEVVERGGNLGQLVLPVDDRCQLAGFDPRNSILGYEDIPERLIMAAVGAR